MYREDDLEIESGLNDEQRRCPVTGRKEKKSMASVLNKKGRLSKFEMDEIFLDD